MITQLGPVGDVTAGDPRGEILAHKQVVVLVVVHGAAPEGPLLLGVELPHAVEEAARREPIEELCVVRRSVDGVVVARQVQIASENEGTCKQQRLEGLEGAVKVGAHIAVEDSSVDTDRHERIGIRELDLCGDKPALMLRGQRQLPERSLAEVDRRSPTVRDVGATMQDISTLESLRRRRSLLN